MADPNRGASGHMHTFVVTSTGSTRATRRCIRCDTTWRWDSPRTGWVENTTAATVWMLVEQGEYRQWCPVSLHTTRAGALAAIPAGAVHEPGDPDPDMCEPEEWVVPWRPLGPLAGARLRIQEWEVTA